MPNRKFPLETPLSLEETFCLSFVELARWPAIPSSLLQVAYSLIMNVTLNVDIMNGNNANKAPNESAA